MVTLPPPPSRELSGLGAGAYEKRQTAGVWKLHDKPRERWESPDATTGADLQDYCLATARGAGFKSQQCSGIPVCETDTTKHDRPTSPAFSAEQCALRISRCAQLQPPFMTHTRIRERVRTLAAGQYALRGRRIAAQPLSRATASGSMLHGARRPNGAAPLSELRNSSYV